MAGRGGRGGGRGGKNHIANDLMRQTAQELGGFPAYYSAVHSEKPGALFPPMPLRKFVFPGWRGRISDTNLIDTAVELAAHDSPLNLDSESFCRLSTQALPAGSCLEARHAKMQAATNRRLLSQLAPVMQSDLFPLELVAPPRIAGVKRGRDTAALRRRRDLLEAQVPCSVLLAATLLALASLTRNLRLQCPLHLCAGGRGQGGGVGCSGRRGQ